MLSAAAMAKRRTVVPTAIPERRPAVRASRYVSVSVELPKGLYAKAAEVASGYGLSLPAWLASLVNEHVGYEARLKPGEMARLLADAKPRRKP
jgi:hypothetical protein